MTDSQLIDRRSFLCSAVLLTGAASVAALAVPGEPARAAEYVTQPNWGWCSLCSQSYYAGSSFKGQGVCPEQPGNGHATPHVHYSQVYDQATTPGLPGTPGYQSGWLWCQYCFSFWWGNGSNPAGCCPAGKGANSNHDGGPSFLYAMPVGLSGSGYQGGWNYCSSCMCLYHSNSGPGHDAGFCWVNSNTLGLNKITHTHGGSWPYVVIDNG